MTWWCWQLPWFQSLQAVRLESIHPGRIRYLVVVTSNKQSNNVEESCVLGIDCHEEATTGLVVPIWADTKINLDGDGGYSITTNHRHHVFKPISVQAMWSSLQTLHKSSGTARVANHFVSGNSHAWTDYYCEKIRSNRSCLNEWFAMEDLTSKRPSSPVLRSKPEEQAKTEELIKSKLKEIMSSVDLDEVTSKFVSSIWLSKLSGLYSC